jgi:hypothetical protein
MNPLLPHVPSSIDAELRAIAEKAAGKRSDYQLHAIGWTRFEYVDAIHRRLRDKWRAMRRGQA